MTMTTGDDGRDDPKEDANCGPGRVALDPPTELPKVLEVRGGASCAEGLALSNGTAVDHSDSADPAIDRVRRQYDLCDRAAVRG